MKVLVTGGCGFIGSHVVDLFVEKGFDVVVIDDLSSGKPENLNEAARFYREDIGSGNMDRIFRDEKPDLISHHAAQISVPLSVREPLLDAETNIKGTIRLLEASRQAGVRRFIFSSTGGAIYGEAGQVPTTEEWVPEPASPYAISKFAAEKYIRYYHHQFALPYTILRYSNVYGPRQIPHGEAGVVAIFTENLLREKTSELYHFPEEPRGMVRDYCYVKDVARANLVAWERGTTGIFNIGTGRGTYTSELYNRIVAAVRAGGRALGAEFNEPRRGLARAGDIRISTLDAKKAEQQLGWTPAFDLDRGLAETVAWYLGHEG